MSKLLILFVISIVLFIFTSTQQITLLNGEETPTLAPPSSIVWGRSGLTKGVR